MKPTFSLVMALLGITGLLGGCGAEDEARSSDWTPEDALELQPSGSELQSCTPSYSRTCTPWGSCDCVSVELGTGRCLKRGQWRTCRGFSQNYDCSTSESYESQFQEC